MWKKFNEKLKFSLQKNLTITKALGRTVEWSVAQLTLDTSNNNIKVPCLPLLPSMPQGTIRCSCSESELEGNMHGIDLLRSRNFNASWITISDPCSISYSSGSSSRLSSTITHHSSWRHKDLASFRLTRARQSHRFD